MFLGIFFLRWCSLHLCLKQLSSLVVTRLWTNYIFAWLKSMQSLFFSYIFLNTPPSLIFLDLVLPLTWLEWKFKSVFHDLLALFKKHVLLFNNIHGFLLYFTYPHAFLAFYRDSINFCCHVSCYWFKMRWLIFFVY